MISVDDARRITREVIHKECDAIPDSEFDDIMSLLNEKIKEAANCGRGFVEIKIDVIGKSKFFWIKLSRKLKELGYNVSINDTSIMQKSIKVSWTI